MQIAYICYEKSTSVLRRRHTTYRQVKLYHKYLLYQNKWISPYLHWLLRIVSLLTYCASLLLILCLVYEYGFHLTEEQLSDVATVHQAVWIVFLVNVTLQLVFRRDGGGLSASLFSLLLKIALYLTLLPVVFHRPTVEGPVLSLYDFVDSDAYLLVVLAIFSLINICNGLVRLLGRRTNPSLILAVSFLIFTAIGTGLLLLPRCTVGGISWIDALFMSGSAVCVTGLSPIDLVETLTPAGWLIIIILIQIGGLGVMTFTSFFALFFMGNTTLYNQLVVRDIVNSNSLNSLVSTMAYILGFSLIIEGAGMLIIWAEIHSSLDMTLREELAFSAFHSISAFCNAGFSCYPDGMGNALLMDNHTSLYLYLSVLVILGSIGFPILVNFKDILVHHLRRLWMFVRYGRRDHRTVHHLYNLNTRIVLLTSCILLVAGTLLIAVLEWNGALAHMSTPRKLVHAFFNSVCARSAGFTSVDIGTFGFTTLLVYIPLMWIGGAAQSTAGGVKVNTFAVMVLNLWAVVRGTDRVEIFGRELSSDSIRRTNATVIMSLSAIFVSIFLISYFEPDAPRLTVVYECFAALTTNGTSLGLTPTLSNAGKLTMVVMMFIGRIGILTLMLGIVRQKRHTKYRYPGGQIIIN